jgi:hypothetical protein
MNLQIRDVKAILTAPEGANLVVVKIETNEPDFMVWAVQRLHNGMQWFTQLLRDI